jgi:hypothetical protein
VTRHPTGSPFDPATAAGFAFHRRAFLGRYCGALGLYALAQLLRDKGRCLAAEPHSAPRSVRGPLALRPPHHRPRAKSVICLFQHGGPSQVDLFDPKPELSRRHGKKYEGDLEIHFHTQAGSLLGSPFTFHRRGECGMELAEVLPHLGGIADDITLVRSMATESVDHEAALRAIHTGKVQAGRPTWGAWVLYGLGSERQDMPAYVVLSDPGGLPIDRTRNWSSGWLPAHFQGTQFRPGEPAVFDLAPPSGVSPGARRRQLEFLAELNGILNRRHPRSDELEARLASYELAARMQLAVPEGLDLSGESEATKRLYGLDRKETAEYGRRCLLARRLVERGVRFVQVFLSGQPWDTHSNNAESLRGLCARTDQPSAALVQDLKARGLLDSTVVLWTGEFGRLPVSQGKDGRDHNRHGFSLWLAGGGFRAGYVHGASDDFGYKAVEDVVRVWDLHATLLHALGLDHTRLTHPHEGRADSLTDHEVTGARVVDGLLA